MLGDSVGYLRKDSGFSHSCQVNQLISYSRVKSHKSVAGLGLVCVSQSVTHTLKKGLTSTILRLSMAAKHAGRALPVASLCCSSESEMTGKSDLSVFTQNDHSEAAGMIQKKCPLLKQMRTPPLGIQVSAANVAHNAAGSTPILRIDDDYVRDEQS